MSRIISGLLVTVRRMRNTHISPPLSFPRMHPIRSLAMPLVRCCSDCLWRGGRRDQAQAATHAVARIITLLVIKALLIKYGHKTLQANAVAVTALTGPLVPLIKSRRPPSQKISLLEQIGPLPQAPFSLYTVPQVLHTVLASFFHRFSCPGTRLRLISPQGRERHSYL